MYLHHIFKIIKDHFVQAGKRYPIEIILILTAGVITIISLQDEHVRADDRKLSPPPTQKILSATAQVEVSPGPMVAVDVSGAVYNPGVYEATAGARFADLIEMAGGISHEADQYFVARNYNMARVAGDQDKIYIPYTWDIALGTFVEEKRILEYLNPLYPGSTAPPYSSSVQDATASSVDLQLSLNAASAQDLDLLPGVGPVTAQKIIDNRPYTNLDELVFRKVVNSSTYDKIKDYITL